VARVLFLTSAHPGGRGKIGAGEGISEGNLRALLDAGHEVHVLCLSPASQSAHPDIVALCTSYTTLRQSLWHSLLAVLYNLGSGALFAPWFFTRCSPIHSARIRRELEERQIVRVWIEFPSSLGFTQMLPGREIDYFVHDVVSQKVSRKPLLRFLLPWVTRIESRLLASVRRCHVISEKDAGLLRQQGFTGPVLVEPPRSIKVGEVRDGIPVDRIVEQFHGAKNLVFFGNMNRPENHNSIMHFLLSSYPHIRRGCPGVQMWIIGLGPRWSLRTLAGMMKGVHVTGPVDDPTSAFSAASICIAPLLFGAGVKIKVMQMLEAGGRVIATPVGAEGIPASARLEVVEKQQFAQAVIKELNG
jgi:hypothetical protein